MNPTPLIDVADIVSHQHQPLIMASTIYETPDKEQ